MNKTLIGLIAVSALAAACKNTSPAQVDPDDSVAPRDPEPTVVPGEKREAASQRVGQLWTGRDAPDDEQARALQRARTEAVRNELEAASRASEPGAEPNSPSN